MNICSLQTKVLPPPPAHCVDSVFPKYYVDKVKSIAKRYFRVYAHIFYNHLEVLRKSGIEKMFYDSLTYFLIFIDMYSLVPSADLRPLASLVNRLVPKLKSTSAPSRSPLVTRLLNQSEEESRQMKLRLHQKDSSSSHPQSLDSEGRTSTSTTHEDCTRLPPTDFFNVSLDQGALQGDAPNVPNAPNASNALNAGFSSKGVSTSKPHSLGNTPGGPSSSVISKDQFVVGANLTTMGAATMAVESRPEDKVNWDAIMKEGATNGQAMSYTESPEGEEVRACGEGDS